MTAAAPPPPDLPPDLPPGLAPHEGRELALMLAGAKPLAMFYDVVPPSIDLPEADFAPHVAAGRLVRREAFYAARGGGQQLRYIYYALPGEAHRITRLHAINAEIHSGTRPATEADDIEIGRLLGYSEAEIAAYLAHVRRQHGVDLARGRGEAVEAAPARR